MNETIGLLLIALGLLFDISGCIGLIRLPDVYNRIQASTKCVTVGTALILLGSVIWLGSLAGAVKGLICIGLVMLASSTAAHALARASRRSGVKLCEGSVCDQYDEETGRGKEEAST